MGAGFRGAEKRQVDVKEKKLMIIAIVVPLGLIAGGVGGYAYLKPKYNVYLQTMRGKADFAEAEINRQIRVEEARAEEEALMMEARGQAEREKLKADASSYAIEQVGAKLNDHPEYLQLHWINEVSGSEGERIYIPTEAGIPILEAGK